MTTANPGDAETTRPTSATPRQGRIPADTFSNRLVLARRLAGLTIREAAAQAGLNYGSWSNWENGMRPQDPVDACTRIADALDVDFNWLLLGGPLAGPRGLPTERPPKNRISYRQQAGRTTDTRPKGRPVEGQRPGAPPRPEQRRPVRISRPHAA